MRVNIWANGWHINLKDQIANSKNGGQNQIVIIFWPLYPSVALCEGGSICSFWGFSSYLELFLAIDEKK